MALGDGSGWDETTPTDLTVAINIDDYNRDLRLGTRSRLAHEHEWPSSQSATSEAGKHKFITLQEQAAKPTIAGTQLAAIYCKTVGAGLQELFYEDEAGTEVQVTSGTAVKSDFAGHTVQVVNVTDGAVNSGAVTIPQDDTIPQVTEGNEWMTLAITPASATNKLIVEVECLMAGRPGGGQSMTLALFNADLHATNALAVSAGYWESNITTTMYLRYYVTAGTTSATTFKVRGGSKDSGTVAFNGTATGTRIYGGAAASSITITEIEV